MNLSNKNYLLTKTNEGKLKLESHPAFLTPEKIYGDELKIAKRYAISYLEHKKNMGILASGQKGSGKTLFAKLIINELKLPTIIITEKIYGEKFINFLTTLPKQTIIFIDEFEKIYNDNESQEQFLSILDGLFSKKQFLFLFTSNTFEINQFLRNRPGRIRYHREYYGIDDKVKKEIIEDLLEDKNKEHELNEVLNLLGTVSVDVLTTLIDEMNMFNETAKESIKHLNIQIEHSYFDVIMFINGKRYITNARFNPVTAGHFWLEYIDSEGRQRYISADSKNMDKSIYKDEFIFYDKSNNNKFIFKPKKPEKLILFN